MALLDRNTSCYSVDVKFNLSGIMALAVKSTAITVDIPHRLIYVNQMELDQEAQVIQNDWNKKAVGYINDGLSSGLISIRLKA